MSYLEPGVYSKTISTRPNTGAGGPSLIPLVIGTGASVMVRTEAIVRGTGTSDTLPVTANEIKVVGYSNGKADFAKGTDYELDSSSKNKINWLVGQRAPAAGESYLVTFTYTVGEDQYTPKLISSINELKEYYGSDLKTEEGNTINNLFVAASILLESGASSIYVLQVKPTSPGQAATAADYQSALDKYAQFIEDIWRIIPADLSDSVNSVIDGHIAKCSSYEERKERCAVYSKESVASLLTGTEVITTVGGYASSKSNARVTVPFPGKATKYFSDGSLRTLTGQFLAAAYAGIESSKPLYTPKTRSTSGVFNEIIGPSLTRVEKNKLASCGVLIFEQPDGPGTNIVIRHQLTTDMSSAETRENSILACKDYVAKYLRSVAETYIGVSAITPDTITKVKGSISAAITKLASDGWVTSGQLVSIAQDADNPDTLILQVSVAVPYPCNYIKIDIIVD